MGRDFTSGRPGLSGVRARLKCVAVVLREGSGLPGGRGGPRGYAQRSAESWTRSAVTGNERQQPDPVTNVYRYDILCDTHDPEAHVRAQRSVEAGLSSGPGSCIRRGGQSSPCDSAPAGGPPGQAQGGEPPCPQCRGGPGPARCRAWPSRQPLQGPSSPRGSGSSGAAACRPLSLLRAAWTRPGGLPWAAVHIQTFPSSWGT